MNLFTSIWLYTKEEVGVLLAVALLWEVGEPATQRLYTGANVLGGAVLGANSTGNSVVPVKVRDTEHNFTRT